MAEPSTSTHPDASSPGDATETQCNETTNLLAHEPPQKPQAVPGAYVDVNRVLPLALTLSLGMAATAATTVFAYAVIICADPARCDAEEEKRAYSGAVAVATGIANLCGALVLGPLQAAVRLNLKAGMFAWIVARAGSVCVLWIAVIYRSMAIAFVGRMLESLATDNLLHYNLSAIFVSSASDGKRFSRLMGTSLALYLAGMASSPTLAGLLPSFLSSFILALALFAASALYLAVLVPITNQASQRGVDATEGVSVRSRYLSFHRPLVDLFRDRRVMLPGVALLLYNITQAYLFPALMVYTTLEFSFTGRENGYVISIAASVSAISLLVVFEVLPRLKKMLGVGGDDAREAASSTRQNLICAVLVMSLQLAALPLITLTAKGWQIFPLVALLAFGIGAPSFIKSYGVALAKDKTAAVASLAMMEIVGGLLSVLILGFFQSWLGQKAVFFAAAGHVAAALLSMIGSRLIHGHQVAQSEEA